jgi:hypothetical protein
MKIECKSMGSLCALDVFKINDIDAEEEDFGSHQDENSDEAEPYGCGDMRFTPRQSSESVLVKYKITQKEYEKVCEKLDKELSFGNCGWCT